MRSTTNASNTTHKLPDVVKELVGLELGLDACFSTDAGQRVDDAAVELREDRVCRVLRQPPCLDHLLQGLTQALSKGRVSVHLEWSGLHESEGSVSGVPCKQPDHLLITLSSILIHSLED